MHDANGTIGVTLIPPIRDTPKMPFSLLPLNMDNILTNDTPTDKIAPKVDRDLPNS